MRQLKFRAWNETAKRYSKPFGLKQDVLNYTDDDGLGVVKSLTNEIVEQFTGLKDKNGKEIYEGDLIEFRRPYRTTQTHTGDNIPNGSYTEPMEPAIETVTASIHFHEGCFCITEADSVANYTDDLPLTHLIFDWDLESIVSAFSLPRRTFDEMFKNQIEEYKEDIEYLIEEHELEDNEGLVEYCNHFEVIGNIHENQ